MVGGGGINFVFEAGKKHLDGAISQRDSLFFIGSHFQIKFKQLNADKIIKNMELSVCVHLMHILVWPYIKLPSVKFN